MLVVSGVLKRAPPIVVVLGATGTGKSKLAIELAQRFNGEIISADAVQMYRGLDIVTNKVTPEERALVKHHCIDFLDPMASSTVVQFRNMALPIIDDVRKREKTPVICGGTNYYIESILWKVLVNETNLEFDGGGDKLEGTNRELHDMLMEVDPLRAEELHVNERRKVERSLQVFRRHGRPHSEILNEQRAANGGGLLGGPMRFPADSVVVIWVQCDQKVLDERCDKRVSKMLESGMLNELRTFHRDYNEKRGQDGADYTQGIFQTIGFKEFHEYLLTGSEDEALFAKGVEQMKLATRQYARRQLKWLNQRFLNANRESPRVYSVDTSSYPHGWTEDVFDPAAEIVQAYFDATEPSTRQPITVNARTYSHDESRKMLRCDLCQLQLKGQLQLDAHLKSNKHKALDKRKQKRLESKAADLDVVLKVTKMKPANDGVMKREDRKQSMASVKSITGLPFHAIKQLLYEKDGDESQVTAKMNNSIDAKAINEGKFDNEHFAIRIESKPLQTSCS